MSGSVVQTHEDCTRLARRRALLAITRRDPGLQEVVDDWARARRRLRAAYRSAGVATGAWRVAPEGSGEVRDLDLDVAAYVRALGDCLMEDARGAGFR